jgi:hypothetical protein
MFQTGPFCLFINQHGWTVWLSHSKNNENLTAAKRPSVTGFSHKNVGNVYFKILSMEVNFRPKASATAE